MTVPVAAPDLPKPPLQAVCEVFAGDSTFETLFFIQVERLGTEVKSQDPQFFSSQILQKASSSTHFFLFFH